MKIERKNSKLKPVDEVKYGEVVEYEGEYYIVGDISCGTGNIEQMILVNLDNGKEKIVSDDTKVLIVDAVLKIS